MANTTNKPQAIVDEKNGSFTLASVDASEADRKHLLSEGTRGELERNGYAVSPFSGVLLVGSPDNYKVVDKENEQAELNNAVRALKEKRAAKESSNLL